jgi:hypothetical protein
MAVMYHSWRHSYLGKHVIPSEYSIRQLVMFITEPQQLLREDPKVKATRILVNKLVRLVIETGCLTSKLTISGSGQSC